MRSTIPLSIAALTLSGFCARDLAAQSEPQGRDAAVDGAFDAAIDVIATSSDKTLVFAADKKLRGGGLRAIDALVKHLDDRRVAPFGTYLTRAVAGRVDMSDHCFWLIQGILEPPMPKKYRCSALSKKNIAEWLSAREGESLAELRRDACISAFAEIAAKSEEYPDANFDPAYRIYAKRLIELDRAVQNERMKKRSSSQATRD